jgi:pilus assembly protein TadC
MWGTLAILACFSILAYLLYDEYQLRARVGRRQRQRARPAWLNYPPRIYIPAVLGVILALIYRASMISPFFLIIGFGITWYLSLRLHIAARLKQDSQILELAVAFRGIFKVRPAVFAALEEARKKVGEPLNEHVAATVQAFYVTSSPQKAYAELQRRVRNPYMDQFVFILERSETASRDIVYTALEQLIHRMRRHEELRSKSEVNLAAITGQTTFIQVLSLIIIFGIGLTAVRNFYVNSTNTQLLFIGLVTVALATSWYIDRRTQAIKERVL